jgi:hypothetical protein
VHGNGRHNHSSGLIFLHLGTYETPPLDCDIYLFGSRFTVQMALLTISTSSR